MKLKKIASLALAGLMAVGMLAGCSGEPTNNGGEGNQIVGAGSLTSSVVADVNADAAVKEAKVTVAAGADITSQLKDFVTKYGNDYETFSVALQQYEIGENYQGAASQKLWNAYKSEVKADDTKVGGMMKGVLVGDTKTVAQLYAVNASVNNELISDMVAETFAKAIATLPADDLLEKTEKNENDIKVTYEYTMSVAYVEDSVDYDYLGSTDETVKYVAIVITGKPVAQL